MFIDWFEDIISIDLIMRLKMYNVKNVEKYFN